MAAIRSSGSLVIRCFKSAEHVADAVTGAAGPVFVAIGWLLIGTGGAAFIDIEVLHRPLGLGQVIKLAPCALVLANLYAQYYYAITTPPGNPYDILPEIQRLAPWLVDRQTNRVNGHGSSGHDTSIASNSRDIEVRSLVRGDGYPGSRLRRCGKCRGPKPIRAHHCRVCKKCVMHMDHHCPWLNQCVGLYNQRYFILFMAWLSVACWLNCLIGYTDFKASLSYRSPWPYWTPTVVYSLVWILCAAMGCAVPVLMTWHLYLISRGETSIEGHDNDYYASVARDRGVVYVNPYDLGRRRNFEMFFNVGPANSGRLAYHTLLLPFRYPPSTTGWYYPLHPIALKRHRPPPPPVHYPPVSTTSAPLSPPHYDSSAGFVVGDQDEVELTDDEEGGGGFWGEE